MHSLSVSEYSNNNSNSTWTCHRDRYVSYTHIVDIFERSESQARIRRTVSDGRIYYRNEFSVVFWWTPVLNNKRYLRSSLRDCSRLRIRHGGKCDWRIQFGNLHMQTVSGGMIECPWREIGRSLSSQRAIQVARRDRFATSNECDHRLLIHAMIGSQCSRGGRPA